MNEIANSEKKNLASRLYKMTLPVEIIVIFSLFTILTKGTFLSARNISNLLMQGVTCSIIATTMMMVIVTTNADLSAGVALGFIGTVAAYIQVNTTLGTVWTFVICILIGAVIGLWHGFWISYRKLPAFIVTYASQLLFKGGTLLITSGASIGPVGDSFAGLGRSDMPKLHQNCAFNDTSLYITIFVALVYIAATLLGRAKKQREGLSTLSWGKTIARMVLVIALIALVSSFLIRYNGFSYAMLLLAILGVVLSFVVSNTTFGRYVFALGGNSEAARLSGINNERVLMTVYILPSVVVSLASIVFLGRVGQATAAAGVGFEFTAITGCVVGGTSILGGRGNVLGAIIGTMLMASLDNGMSLLNLGATYQYLIKGLVLMLAIAMDVGFAKKKQG